MSLVLRDVGVEVVERGGDEEPPDELADALVVDVDSGTRDTSSRAAAYLDDERVVLFCGLRESREKYADALWVDRPFTPTAFLAECVDALGLRAEELESGGIDSADAAATNGVDSASDDTDDTEEAEDEPPSPPDRGRGEDEPITRELGYDEAMELERRLGLNPGVLGNANSEPTVSDEESFEVIDLDDSSILEMDELQFALGGKLVGEVEGRRVGKEEIEQGRESEIQIRIDRSPTFNQTMPDTPMALGSDIDDTHDRRVGSNVGSDIGSAPREGAEAGSRPGSAAGNEPSSPAEESSVVDLSPGAGGADLAAQIKGVARMLAESWQRIALTSRTEDRADRIERVLIAAVGKGLRGASAEVQRIPPAAGFAGALSTLTFVDTVRTIRDRRLRGRLEVAVGDDAFVLHMDGGYLEEIDTLSGNVDGMLLDILHQGGALEDRAYEELVDAFESGRFMGPLEVELARQHVVADATLQSARVVRAREVFRRLCGTRGGQFAFLEIRPGDRQPWPVDPLHVNVDQLLLELLRESSIDTGDSRATARTLLVLDPNRAASLEQSRLTDEERSVMMFFREGETLESARERLQKQAGPEEVDRIVDRLKKVELLKRSEPEIAVEPEVEKKVEEKLRSKTVVSDISDVLSEDERRRDAGDDDLTTSLKPNWDISLPDPLDTGEVDELIDEALNAYESEAKDTVESDDDDP